MLALGWTLFAALYAIGLVCTLAINVASYGDRDNLLKWRWRWSLLAWPLMWMSDAWDSRERVVRALRRLPQLRTLRQRIARIRCWWRNHHVFAPGGTVAFRFDIDGYCGDCGKVRTGVPQTRGE